jgi:8-oxo-dGTP pyrophosphatase MutT (NUDIX family)
MREMPMGIRELYLSKDFLYSFSIVEKIPLVQYLQKLSLYSVRNVTFGKSYIETAVNELSEELGILANESELKFKGEVLVKLPKSNEFFHVFEYNLKPTDKIQLEETEVSSLTWLSIDEIKESVKHKTLDWYARPIQVVSNLY